MEDTHTRHPHPHRTSQDTLPMTLDELHNTISDIASGINSLHGVKRLESAARKKESTSSVPTVIRERRPPRTLSASILSSDASSRKIVNRSKKIHHSLSKSLKKVSKEVRLEGERRSRLGIRRDGEGSRSGIRDERRRLMRKNEDGLRAIQKDVESKSRKLVKARDSLRKFLDDGYEGGKDDDKSDGQEEGEMGVARGKKTIIPARSSEDLLAHMRIRDVIRSEMHGFLAEFFASQTSSHRQGGNHNEDEDDDEDGGASIGAGAGAGGSRSGGEGCDSDWMRLLRQWIRIEVESAFEERERDGRFRKIHE